MNDKLKIAFLTNNPNLGSTARVFLDWFEYLENDDNDFVVCLPKTGPLDSWLDQRDFRKYIIDTASLSGRSKLNTLITIAKAAIFFRRNKVRLIHCMEHNCYPMAWRIAKILGIPVVCHVQYVLDAGFSRWAFGNNHPPAALVWTAESQRLDSRDAVEGLLNNTIETVLPMGVDTKHFGNRSSLGEEFRSLHRISPDHVVFGIACALRPRKKLEDFITLIAALRTENSSVIGLIAGGTVRGEEPYLEVLKSQIDSLGLRNHVLFVGDIVDIEGFHQATDVSVSTSEYETFGMSVCEAMACCKPVIGYAAGSVREVVGNDDCIVETHDLVGLTRIAKQLVREPELRRTLGQRNRQRVQDVFCPYRTYIKIKQLYHELLEVNTDQHPHGSYKSRENETHSN